MNNDDPVKKSDQIKMLEACAKFTDTEVWEGIFSYPGCGWDLVQSGLVTEDKKITTAGRAALFLLGKGSDPTPGKSFVSFALPLPQITPTP